MSTGSKYHRKIHSVESIGGSITVDVYSVLEAFQVECPARQHAIKKLLCAGIRGKGDVRQDLQETLDAVRRAIELEEQRRYAPTVQQNLAAMEVSAAFGL